MAVIAVAVHTGSRTEHKCNIIRVPHIWLSQSVLRDKVYPFQLDACICVMYQWFPLANLMYNHIALHPPSKREG